MEWGLADARTGFSELINRALAEGPQRVVRRNDAFVIVAQRDYDKLPGKRVASRSFSWARVRAWRGSTSPAIAHLREM